MVSVRASARSPCCGGVNGEVDSVNGVLARAAAECDGEGDGVGARGRAQNDGAQGARLAGGEGDLEGARPAGDGGAMG